jgi:adenine phosphoribosyltransferase
MDEIRTLIRDIPDFPKPGIVFKDITPVLADGRAFAGVVDALAARYRGRVDMVVGIESRGFLLGAPVAYALGIGVGVVRKPGKLPWEKISASYDLEYGTDTLEMHLDGLGHKRRVVVVDDLLATGGTASAAVDLVRRLGGEVVEAAFLVELGFLKGREKLRPLGAFSLVVFGEE